MITCLYLVTRASPRRAMTCEEPRSAWQQAPRETRRSTTGGGVGGECGVVWGAMIECRQESDGQGCGSATTTSKARRHGHRQHEAARTKTRGREACLAEESSRGSPSVGVTMSHITTSCLPLSSTSSPRRAPPNPKSSQC